MTARSFRLVLTLCLAASLVFAAFASVSATSHEGPTWIYFPWVPNGNMLGESGPFHGSVTIQNLEAVSITVYYQTTDNGVFVNLLAFESFPLNARGSRSLSAADLEIPAGGSGLMVTARTTVGGNPARIAGVQKQAAPVGLDTDHGPMTLGLEGQTIAEHQTVGGYTGLTQNDVGRDLVLPIVQTNTGWNTFIRVTNFEDSGGLKTAEVTLQPAGGGAAEYTSVNIAAGQTGTINLADHVPPGWVGSALIEAEADVAAVAERFKAETHMLIINSSESVENPANTQMAPLVLNNWNHWNTGISLANLSGSENEVMITWYGVGGDVVDTEEFKIQPWGMNFVYTPSSGGGGSGFVGSAIIAASHPFAGVVDEVKYSGNDGDTGHAMSYMLTADLAEKGEALALPLAQRGELPTGMGDTTGIQIFNPTNEDVELKIWLFQRDGGLVEFSTAILLEKQGLTFYMFDPDIGWDNLNAAAVIHVDDGDGGVVAVSNNVNYAVQFDGSASFNLVKTIWSPPLAIALEE